MEDNGTPLLVLGLSIRPYNSLRREGIHTVEDLKELSDEELLWIRNIGEKSFIEIKQKISSFVAPEREGMDELEEINPVSTTIWGNGISIGELNLSNATNSALKRADISTLGEILNTLKEKELTNISNLGVSRQYEIFKELVDYERVHPLTNDNLVGNDQPISILRLGNDVGHKLTDMGIRTIGGLYYKKMVNVRELIRLHPKVYYEVLAKLLAYCSGYEISEDRGKDREKKEVKEISIDEDDIERLIRELLHNLHERDQHVIKMRYKLDGEPHTLEEAGIILKVTRERVRQLEKRSMRHLMNIMIQSEYREKSEILSERSRDVIRSLRKRVFDISHFAVRDSLFHTILQIHADSKQGKIGEHIEFLLKLLEIERLDFGDSHLEVIWVNTEAIDRTSLKVMITSIDRLLTYRKPKPLSENEIAHDVDFSRLDVQGLKQFNIRRILDLCSSIEECGVGFWRGKFEYLRKWTDQADRLLKENGEPIHFRSIANEINSRIEGIRKKKVGLRNLANQIAGDERFEPIGRSGFWALKEWDIEDRPILDLMIECFNKEKRPLLSTEVFNYVDDRRVVTEGSIKMYLNFNEAFSKVGKELWVLSSWPEVNSMKRWDRQGVEEFLDGVFSQEGVETIEYSFLRDLLIKEANVGKRQAQGMLNSNYAIKIYNAVDSGKLIAELNPSNKRTYKYQRAINRKRKTVREKVDMFVRKLLEEAPTHSMPLRELVDKLVSEYEKPRHTFYAYISALEYIEKKDDPESNQKICILLEN